MYRWEILLYCTVSCCILSYFWININYCHWHPFVVWSWRLLVNSLLCFCFFFLVDQKCDGLKSICHAFLFRIQIQKSYGMYKSLRCKHDKVKHCGGLKDYFQSPHTTDHYSMLAWPHSGVVYMRMYGHRVERSFVCWWVPRYLFPNQRHCHEMYSLILTVINGIRAELMWWKHKRVNDLFTWGIQGNSAFQDGEDIHL